MIEHNQNSCFLLACIMLKMQGCPTESFNEFCAEMEEDLLASKDLFDTCVNCISQRDKEAMLAMSTLFVPKKG